MSCATFRERWDDTGAADAHADACVSCRGWVARQRRARAALSQFAQTLDASSVPPRIEQDLRRAFREAHALRARPVVAVFVPGRWAWALLGAAACAAIATALVRVPARSPRAAFVVADARRSEPRPVAPLPGVVRSPWPRPPQARPAVVEGPDGGIRQHLVVASSESSAPGTSRSRHAVSATLAQASDKSEVVASSAAPVTGVEPEEAEPRAFYPLVAEPVPSLVDSGQVVRVQLREDAIRAAGLPTGPGLGERVEAEVLFGPDGVARGIRIARPRR